MSHRLIVFLKPIKESFEKHSGLKLALLETGPKVAMEDLLKRNIDSACAGLSFEDWVDLMKKEANLTLKKEDFKIFKIGEDKVIVMVHPTNPVNKLTKEQLKGIFTGKIQNWKEVGGKDQLILVVWGRLIPGTNKTFIDSILDGERPLKEVLEVGTAMEIKQTVALTPEAIGIGPEAMKKEREIKIIEGPQVGRPVICVTLGEPSPNLKKLFDFIKAQPIN
ncbi:MAG: substrate-binding domain-containing protein [Caldimicrobium sp.]|nr:substrate-binding domain-containing protein [Caldimicrobium sp.]